MSEPTVYLTVAEVATRLRLSKMTVYRMVRSGELKALRIGPASAQRQNLRIPEGALSEYIAQNTTGGPEPAEPADP